MLLHVTVCIRINGFWHINTTRAIKDETGSLHRVFPECLQDRHVTAAQTRQQLLTGPRNQIQQLICWELSNLISELPTLDPLRSGMSHGEERGGEGRPHFSAGTTKPCYTVVLVWGMTQVLLLGGAQIAKNVVWSVLWGREPPAACHNTGNQQAGEHQCLVLNKSSYKGDFRAHPSRSSL